MFKIGDKVYAPDPETPVVEQELDGFWIGKILCLDPENYRALVGYETDYYYNEKWFNFEDLTRPIYEI